MFRKFNQTFFCGQGQFLKNKDDCVLCTNKRLEVFKLKKAENARRINWVPQSFSCGVLRIKNLL